ncbi:hypothetical protein PR048_004517 [Dryococelus australis]|uniref:Transposase n=1 Tax=Dryococelus australis TaxID=614101 RepID=A0ABQ9I626_9NEOP|nr:hypothetical protein PR048_004517 [Dryococelus australis]
MATKGKRPHYHSYTQEAMVDAVNAVQNSNMGVRGANRRFGVPKTSLQDRLSGRVALPSDVRGMGPNPYLSSEEEHKLAQWLKDLAKSGFPWKVDDLLNSVQQIVKASNKTPFKNGRPGCNNFMHRHQLVSRMPKSHTKGRTIITEEFIRKWFREFEEYIKDIGADDVLQDTERILNGDETSFSLCPKTGEVIVPKGWLEKENIKKPVVLFVDGHKSHLTLDLRNFFSQNGIILYALPPNTTHIMQPADVNVLKPLKSDWKETVRKWQKDPQNVNTVLTKSKFAPLLSQNKLESLVPVRSQIGESEIETAELVVKTLQHELVESGVNSDILLAVLKEAKERILGDCSNKNISAEVSNKCANGESDMFETSSEVELNIRQKPELGGLSNICDHPGCLTDNIDISRFEVIMGDSILDESKEAFAEETPTHSNPGFCFLHDSTCTILASSQMSSPQPEPIASFPVSCYQNISSHVELSMAIPSGSHQNVTTLLEPHQFIKSLKKILHCFEEQ